MDKSQAITSIKGVWGESFSLEPSSLLTLFEISIADIGIARGKISVGEANSDFDVTFRFHNSIKLTNSSIYWNKKEYIACPIMAEGFEITSRGTLPTPKLSITVSDDNIPQLTILKDRINQLGDLVGAKVTRIRTFAKFLDAENFFGTVAPEGFAPDPNSELPRDVFYIDSKNEDKNTVQYQLASILDLEGVKTPGRLVTSNSCTHTYRGQGCFYEFNSRRNVNEHGEIGDSILPEEAPPIMTQFNEYISDILSGIAITDFGEFNSNRTYNSGNYVFIEHNDIKYYFVANGVDINIPPPNLNYWIPDLCSKQIVGCEPRYAVGGAAKGNVILGNLPIATFPSVNRFK